jgi:hypothetical protein
MLPDVLGAKEIAWETITQAEFHQGLSDKITEFESNSSIGDTREGGEGSPGRKPDREGGPPQREAERAACWDERRAAWQDEVDDLLQTAQRR